MINTVTILINQRDNDLNAVEMGLDVAERMNAKVKVAYVFNDDWVIGLKHLFTPRSKYRTMVEMDHRIGTTAEKYTLNEPVETIFLRSINARRMARSELLASDLIVVSKEARSVDPKLVGLLPSVTEKLLKHLRAPILTVNRENQRFNFNEILFTSEFRPAHQPELRRAAFFARLMGAKLRLVGVTLPTSVQTKKTLERRIQRQAMAAGAENYTIHSAVDQSTEKVVLDKIARFGPDLVAVPRTFWSKWRHILSGSLAEDLIMNQPKPVLTLRPHKEPISMHQTSLKLDSAGLAGA